MNGNQQEIRKSNPRNGNNLECVIRKMASTLNTYKSIIQRLIEGRAKNMFKHLKAWCSKGSHSETFAEPH